MDVAVKSVEHIFSSRGFSSYLSPQKLMISPFPTLNISLVAVTSLQNNEALWLFLCFSLVDSILMPYLSLRILRTKQLGGQ